MQYNRYLIMGAILLTALFLILTADMFIISHPISGYIHSRNMSDIQASYWSIIIGIFLPLMIAWLYALVRQKRKETDNR
ncbi:hypothetical protein Mpsy_0940 [Methanolobus psychrophilus R15]|nr:hypothetical protein Mpsy_0940 [Methanolobus psychrophilus R15]